MSSSKLHKAGTGREDVIPVLLGTGDGSRSRGAAPQAPPAQGTGGTERWISSHTKTWLTGKIISFLTNSVASVG